jgi:tRNA 2-thiouridine synthesizing protein E
MKSSHAINLDENGHLCDYLEWEKSVGEYLAAQDEFDLNQQHWKIIDLVRNIYLKTETTPPMRLLIKVIKNELNENMASSRYLYQLFPEGPVRLACKYGGLPKPKHCI